ncbi:MAG: FAD-dependent oxidoreductase, partial [Anaerolineales bacterium]|nr:FAD-dependent oxidoreductase [Anaerolineales bacterium]
DLLAAERFPPFCANVSNTGYYGFSAQPRAGVVKIANHDLGRHMAPDASGRTVTESENEQLRAFPRASLPLLAEAPILHMRACLYCDTWDGYLWIAADPARPGLVLATGGSGHAFKFAPLLGDWIAGAVEGRPNPLLANFRGRASGRPRRSQEAARCQLGA